MSNCGLCVMGLQRVSSCSPQSVLALITISLHAPFHLLRPKLSTLGREVASGLPVLALSPGATAPARPRSQQIASSRRCGELCCGRALLWTISAAATSAAASSSVARSAIARAAAARACTTVCSVAIIHIAALTRLLGRRRSARSLPWTTRRHGRSPLLRRPAAVQGERTESLAPHSRP